MRLMQQRTGALLVLASAVAFGVMPIFGKLAFEAGVGVATLLVRPLRDRRPGPVGRRRARRAVPQRRPRRPAGALALGAVGYSMQAGLYFLALERMDASVLSLILYSYPALVTGAAILLRRDRPTAGASSPSSPLPGASCSCSRAPARAALDLAGIAFGVGAALTYTTYILVSDGVRNLDPLPLAALVSPARPCARPRGRGDGHAGPRVRRLGLDLARLAALVSTVAPSCCSSAGCRGSGPRRRRSSRRSSRR